MRSFRSLEGMGDSTSVSIVLDLRRAMGDDPSHPVSVLTPHQRRAIQLHLIDDAKASDVAKQLGISQRVVYITVNRGLKAILAYLQGDQQTQAKTWFPWMFEVMRDPRLTPEQIAQKVGKTTSAVNNAMSRYRESESIPYRSRR